MDLTATEDTGLVEFHDLLDVRDEEEQGMKQLQVSGLDNLEHGGCPSLS